MCYKFVFYLWLFLFTLTCYSQVPNKRFFWDVNVSKSYAYFSSGKTLLTGNNDISLESKYQLESGNSFDWQRPPQLSFVQNIGRSLHFKFGIQSFLNKRISVTTALELGGRTFALYENSVMVVYRSYRNYSLPMLCNYSRQINNDHYITVFGGVSLNIPTSSSAGTPFYRTKAFSPIYPLAVLGVEWERRLKRGSGIAINLGYNLGFFNIINDEIDYFFKYKSTGQSGRGISKVMTNGTHFNAGVRFYYQKSKPKASKIKTHEQVGISYSKRQIEKMNLITVDTNIIKVCLWDDQRIDGDSISIEYKDSVVIENISLIKSKKCIELKLEKNQPNYLIIHAVNEGRIKPNTIKVSIKDTKEEAIIDIRADLIRSGAINLQIR